MTTKKTNTKNNKTNTLAVRLINDLIYDLERTKEDAENGLQCARADKVQYEIEEKEYETRVAEIEKHIEKLDEIYVRLTGKQRKDEHDEV